jgi:hypothetical protein
MPYPKHLGRRFGLVHLVLALASFASFVTLPVSGCASLLGADFDRPPSNASAGDATDANTSDAATSESGDGGSEASCPCDALRRQEW